MRFRRSEEADELVSEAASVAWRKTNRRHAHEEALSLQPSRRIEETPSEGLQALEKRKRNRWENNATSDPSRVRFHEKTRLGVAFTFSLQEKVDGRDSLQNNVLGRCFDSVFFCGILNESLFRECA